MNPKLSLQFNNEGRTALADEPLHIRDLIEQVLFTSPSERVNRPNFGSGLLQTIFQGNSNEIAATTQFLVQSAINQYLGHLITVNEVKITNNEALLNLTITYTLLRTQERQIAQFTQ